jgi:hypothetical protein
LGDLDHSVPFMPVAATMDGDDAAESGRLLALAAISDQLSGLRCDR